MKEIFGKISAAQSHRAFAVVLVLFLAAAPAAAQTSSLAYQGRLADGAFPANGTYDMQFALYDAATGTGQVGSTITNATVQVTGGIFTVTLDFGANAFSGPDRFLEIRVRQAGSPNPHVVLDPRQPITSSPYSIRSLNSETALNAVNAAQLGSVPADQFVLTGDGRLSDARPPTAGSGDYIQNKTSPQAASNFNISGTGTAAVFNAATQFNIGGNRVLSVAGNANTFAGRDAGLANTTGISNSFFGRNAGLANSTGGGNSLFGHNAGQANSTAFANAFFGAFAGSANTTGDSNAFFGSNAGETNITGRNNTIIGANADVGSDNLTNATAIGAGVVVNSSNTIVLGRINDAVIVPGPLTANGAGMMNLNASNITSGTLATSRLDVVTTDKGGTGVATAGAAGNFLRSNGVIWNSLPLQPSDLPPGSSNYIHNQTFEQATSNFNISGTGTAGIFDAATQYNIGGSRVFSVGFGLSFGNTFVGRNAGTNNTGDRNSFFGNSAGAANTTGDSNSFFGATVGGANTTGDGNSFFGFGVGNVSSGSRNSFFGTQSGFENSSGSFNSFVGAGAGSLNTTGSNNTIIGANADLASGNLVNATAIGFRAEVSQNNSLVLGSIDGVNFATADTNVGIGTTAPAARFHVVGDTSVFSTPVAIIQSSGSQVPITFRSGPAEVARMRADSQGNLVFATLSGTDKDIYFRAGDDAETDLFVHAATGNVGIGTTTPDVKLDVNGIIRVATLGAAGASALCRNASNQLSTCSSSARYKSNIAQFNGGLELLKRLRPVSFNWKDGGMRDMGLVAEDVAVVEPLLTTTNEKGEIEGVKYDRVGVVLINAVNQQQELIQKQSDQIERLTKQIREQQVVIDSLRRLLCQRDSKAEVCREEK
jgi:hypothetical protein